MEAKKLRVVIADDHEITLKGLKVILEESGILEVVGIAGNGAALLEQCQIHKPDIVFTDINMPVMDGITATKEIIKIFPHILVLGLSMYEDDYTVADILTAGARGFLSKGASGAEIAEAVSRVSEPDGYYCGSGTMALHELLKKHTFKKIPVSAMLYTKREREVMQLLCEGYSTQGIASKLFISPFTVSGHRANLLEKTGSDNTPGIIVYAIQNGLYKEAPKQDKSSL